MFTHPIITSLAPRWTDTPPFNNAINTALTSIGLSCIALSAYMIISSLIKDRQNLMYQDNGIAGLICCYPFRVLDRRRRRKEAEWEKRFGYLARGEEPPLLSSVQTPCVEAEMVRKTDGAGLGNNPIGCNTRLLREDGIRMESIDITRI